MTVHCSCFSQSSRNVCIITSLLCQSRCIIKIWLSTEIMPFHMSCCVVLLVARWVLFCRNTLYLCLQGPLRSLCTSLHGVIPQNTVILSSYYQRIKVLSSSVSYMNNQKKLISVMWNLQFSWQREHGMVWDCEMWRHVVVCTVDCERWQVLSFTVWHFIILNISKTINVLLFFKDKNKLHNGGTEFKFSEFGRLNGFKISSAFLHFCQSEWPKFK